MFQFEEGYGVFCFYFLDVYVQILKNIFLPKWDWVISVESRIKESCYLLLSGMPWPTSVEAVFSGEISIPQGRWKILWGEADLLANGMSPMPTIRYAFKDWLRWRSFHSDFVHWSIRIFSSYLLTSSYQHL